MKPLPETPSRPPWALRWPLALPSPALLLLVVGLLAMPSATEAESLTLRVNDTDARPGQLVALVIRTYAPRGIGQGQLCFRALSQNVADPLAVGRGAVGEGGNGPFEALEDFIVWSTTGDAMAGASFDDTTQTALLDFSSASGSINLEDGAMAALVFRLRPDVLPNSVFGVGLDGADSFLVDAQGQPVPLEIRAGEMTILPLAAPRNLAAEGDDGPPGGLVQLGISTQEIFPIAQGQVAFLYDPSVAQSLPTVTVDGRHGNASVTIDQSQSGRILASFTSPDQSLNSIPGQFIRIDLRLRANLPVGTSSTVRLDPAESWLQGPDGLYDLILEEDLIEVTSLGILFADGFESGSPGGWSNASP